jgi:GNAT superfamily N-acetyltransferase
MTDRDAVHVRSATPDDAETIHRFIVELATFEREPEAVEATPDTLRRQLRETPPPFECLIAERDGDAAGFALFFPTYSTWLGRPGLYLEDLYVSPAHRRKGVATALFRRLAAIAFERGYGRLELAVLGWNRRAMDFYRARGGRPLDEWTAYRFTHREVAALAGGLAPGNSARTSGDNDGRLEEEA